MDRQIGKKGYHAMKEQNLDDLERMFKEGLQDLKAEPDEDVWIAIQAATKRRNRFWLFWSIGGMMAIGLVSVLLLQLPSGQSGERDESSRLQDPSSKFQNPEPGNESRHPEQANKFSGSENEPRRVDGPEATRAEVPAAQQPTANSQQPTANSLQLTTNSQQLTANSQQLTANIPSLTIPFLFQYEAPYSLVYLAGYVPPVANTGNPPADSSKAASPWSLGFNPGLLLPAVQSAGKSGAVAYEKTNVAKPGISFGINLNYTFKQQWMFRAGFDWSAYTVSGNQRYFGYTDTVEWIDRERNTGFLVLENDRNWKFESRYEWIGIPVELGRRQNFGSGFSWEWTIGGGINYLYRYGKIANGNNYLTEIDNSIKRLQLNVSAGFGVNYQLKGPWSTFVNVRYRYQPFNLYDSGLLMEKHQLLRFGVGVRYQFKWKGN